MDQTSEASPRLMARIAGGLYLIVIIVGAFHYGFVRSAMVVAGDPTATSANILKHEFLYRLGFAAPVIMLLCNVPLALIFYDLFKVVKRSVAVLVALFGLVGTAIETVNLLKLGPLHPDAIGFGGTVAVPVPSIFGLNVSRWEKQVRTARRTPIQAPRLARNNGRWTRK